MTVLIKGFAHVSEKDGMLILKTGGVPDLGHALVYVHENDDGSQTVMLPTRTRQLMAALLKEDAAIGKVEEGPVT